MKKNGQKENCAPKSPKNHLREEKVAENDDQGAFRSEKKTNPTPRRHSRGGLQPYHWPTAGLPLDSEVIAVLGF